MTVLNFLRSLFSHQHPAPYLNLGSGFVLSIEGLDTTHLIFLVVIQPGVNTWGNFTGIWNSSARFFQLLRCLSPLYKGR